MSSRLLLFGGDPKEHNEKYLQHMSVIKNVIMNKQYIKMVGHTLHQIIGMNITNTGNIFEKITSSEKFMYNINQTLQNNLWFT